MKKKHKGSAAKPAHVTSIAPAPAKMQHVGMSASHGAPKGGNHVTDGMAKGSLPKTTMKAASDKKKGGKKRGGKNPMEKAFGKMKGKYEVM